jgi:DNA-binding NtrC family response regulator
VRDVSAGVLLALESYDWPGNIRELDNAVQRALILSNGPTLDVRDMWTPHVDPARSDEPTLVEVERRHITHVLEACRGRIEGPKGAAGILGLRPSTLRSRMAKLGIGRRLEPMPSW